MDDVLSQFRWDLEPDLKDPFLVMGFQGWSNAGNVSSDTLRHFIDTLAPRRVATLSDEGFLNYTLDRPVARIEEGAILELDPMTTELVYWTNPGAGHDLLFLLGKEPHLNWLGYSRVMLGVIKRLRVKRLYTIGGVQDTISHAAPPLVTLVGSSVGLVAMTAELEHNLRPADYHGPVSIHSYLVRSCMDEGVEAISLWGHVPAYLQRSPRLVAKMVTILNRAAGMECPLDTLRQKSIELERKIEEALSRDPNLKQFVESIEDKDDSANPGSPDDKVIRLNQFLRRDKKDPDA